MAGNSRIVLRVAGLALLAFLAGIAIYFGARAPVQTAGPATIPVAPAETSAPARTAAPEQESPAPPVAAQPPTPVVPAAHTTGPDLTGTWALLVEDDDGTTNEWERYTLELRDGNLTGESLYRKGLCDVVLDGMQIRIVNEFEGRTTLTFVGVLNPSHTEAKGTYDHLRRYSDPAIEDYRETYPAQLVRLTDEVLKTEKQERELREKRFAEARGIFEALKRFAARNEGKLPGSLSQLTPDDLSDRSLVASQPNRRITYTGGATLTRMESVAEIDREFRAKGLSTEGLVEYERKLREVWGGETPFQTHVLRIDYDNPPLAVDVAPSGALNIGGTDEQGAFVESTPAELRDAEFNNLKQLGLVFKMFGHENKDYLPGGWLMVYPEYLADPDVLRSPWAPEGTSSYELLFPGETEKRLEELAQQLIDSGALQAETASQSIIPAIAARDNLPADPGQPPARAVLFLDGHVEAVPLADWDTRIAPFLR